MSHGPRYRNTRTWLPDPSITSPPRREASVVRPTQPSRPEIAGAARYSARARRSRQPRQPQVPAPRAPRQSRGYSPHPPVACCASMKLGDKQRRSELRTRDSIDRSQPALVSSRLRPTSSIAPVAVAMLRPCVSLPSNTENTTRSLCLDGRRWSLTKRPALLSPPPAQTTLS